MALQGPVPTLLVTLGHVPVTQGWHLPRVHPLVLAGREALRVPLRRWKIIKESEARGSCARHRGHGGERAPHHTCTGSRRPRSQAGSGRRRSPGCCSRWQQGDTGFRHTHPRLCRVKMASAGTGTPLMGSAVLWGPSRALLTRAVDAIAGVAGEALAGGAAVTTGQAARPVPRSAGVPPVLAGVTWRCQRCGDRRGVIRTCPRGTGVEDTPAGVSTYAHTPARPPPAGTHCGTRSGNCPAHSGTWRRGRTGSGPRHTRPHLGKGGDTPMVVGHPLFHGLAARGLTGNILPHAAHPMSVTEFNQLKN